MEAEEPEPKFKWGQRVYVDMGNLNRGRCRFHAEFIAELGGGFCRVMRLYDEEPFLVHETELEPA